MSSICDTDSVVKPYTLILGRIEVCQKLSSCGKHEEIKRHVRHLLHNHPPTHVCDLTIKQFYDTYLDEHVEFVSLCDTAAGTQISELDQLEIFVYQLHNTELEVEDMECEDEICAANHWLLPSTHFQGLWESLVFDDSIKNNLLQYARTTLLFSDCNVDANIISWNRLILLHGPPGTGKTSLCKALAHKLTIVLQERYRHGQLIEINSHSLFSKWFSESGKLVMKMFAKIQEYVKDSDSLVCVLIDEVESLSASRQSMSASEPSDAIRVVNALLTQLDLIKRHPNVLILTTSNITGVIDVAFLDRADIRQYIGLPSVTAIYQILYTCIQELIRAKIIVSNDQLLQHQMLSCLSDVNDIESFKFSRVLLNIASCAVGLSGRTLRKLPFIAHSLYLQVPTVSLEQFLVALMRSVERHKSDPSLQPTTTTTMDKGAVFSAGDSATSNIANGNCC